VVTDPWGGRWRFPGQRDTRSPGSATPTRRWRRGSGPCWPSWWTTCVRGSAPGRLDLLGGVADYSGALVLEMPTRRVDRGRRPPRRRLCRRSGHLPWPDLERLAGLPFDVFAGSSPGAPLDALRHRCRRGAGAPRGDRTAPGPARDHSDLPCRWEWPRARRSRWRRPVRSAPLPSIRSAWRRCARRRRTMWWARRAGSWIRSRWRWGPPGRCCRFCAGRRPWRPGGVAGGSRDRGLAHRRPHDVGGVPYRASPRRRLHGEAHGGGCGRAGVALGEPAAVSGGRRAAGRARGPGLPRDGGAPPVTTSRPCDPTRRIQCGPPQLVRRRGARAGGRPCADGCVTGSRSVSGR
jgi:hypothetical protein